MRRNLLRRLDAGAPELKSVEAVLVSVNGRTVIAEYRSRTPSKQTNVWPVTTSVMGLLVGIAVGEGHLGLEQTLAELLPKYRSQMTTQVASITLRQLLTMTSGIPDRAGGFTLSADDAVAQILSYGTLREPGVAFEYSRAAAHLVGAVLAEAVGRSVLDYAREKLFDPLGIDTRPAWQRWDAFDPRSRFHKPGFAWGADRQGIHSGCCMLKLSTPDMLKIGQLHLNEGRWRGSQIVSAEWVRESSRSQLTPEQQIDEEDYGYLWWVGEDYGYHWFDSGWYGHFLLGVPELGLVIAVSSKDGVDDQFQEILLPVIHEVLFKPFAQ